MASLLQGADARTVSLEGSPEAGNTKPADSTYSSLVCSIFMLNMVLGTGPMTLPYAFNQAGFVLSMIFLALLMFLSFITTTFVVESLATANSIQRKLGQNGSPVGVSESEQRGNVIHERFEIGALGEKLLPGRLYTLPYIILIVYAYGVLTVYVISGVSSLSTEIGEIGGIDSYYIIHACFVVVATPICLLDFSKTRPLQIFIGAVRIAAVLSMMALMIRYMIIEEDSDRKRQWRDIPLWNSAGLPSLFGNAAFTFMVHHSLPCLVFSLDEQRFAARSIATSYLLAYVVYFFLGFLALFCFTDAHWSQCSNSPSHPCTIQKLFNTNFSSNDLTMIGKFIVCYPILVISVFPLVAITLRNNWKALCAVKDVSPATGTDWKHYGFTALTVAPPFVVALISRDVQVVMTYVGGYFGLALMFLIPSLLVWYARAIDPTSSSSVVGSFCHCGMGVVVILTFFFCAVVYNTIVLFF
eukprot:TRINITY_DN21132_c0_g2_i1.p1 TRINITY_DN21132_c0_g2~~TRINITY_DN21132_c0_g2_i1.p1  ORF type:complete len:500 (+),score=55.46 TRINITY_DN21132_c0_g2_i1:92-1501(+)